MVLLHGNIKQYTHYASNIRMYARIWDGHVLLLLGDEVHSPGACLITWPCVSCVIYVYLQDGKTALHHAASSGQLEAVRVLVQEFKLDPTHTWQGKLHLVVLSTLPHCPMSVGRMWLEYCVTVLNVLPYSLFLQSGKTPMDIALSSGNNSLASAFLEDLN